MFEYRLGEDGVKYVETSKWEEFRRFSCPTFWPQTRSMPLANDLAASPGGRRLSDGRQLASPNDGPICSTSIKVTPQVVG